jgi:hypothetical protein
MPKRRNQKTDVVVAPSTPVLKAPSPAKKELNFEDNIEDDDESSFRLEVPNDADKQRRLLWVTDFIFSLQDERVCFLKLFSWFSSLKNINRSSMFSLVFMTLSYAQSFQSTRTYKREQR